MCPGRSPPPSYCISTEKVKKFELVRIRTEEVFCKKINSKTYIYNNDFRISKVSKTNQSYFKGGYLLSTI